MANLFRMKVIESNAICRNLFAKGEVKSVFVDVKEEFSVPVTEEPMYEEYLDESFLQVIERQPVIPNKQCSLPTVKFPNRCFVCKKEVKATISDSVKNYAETLYKIVPVHFNPRDRVCRDCRVKIRNADNHFQQVTLRHAPKKDSAYDNPCQFCYKRCREVNLASVAMVSTFMLLPQPTDQRNVLVGGRSCAACVKNLASIADLHKILKEFQTETENSNKIVAKESTFDNMIAINDNYQCHMSEIEDADSDTSMPEILFGEPLNTPRMKQRFRCNSCMYTFAELQRLQAHEAIYHQTPSKVCDICNREFSSKTICKQHKCRVHFGDVFDGYYKKLCEFCGLFTKQLEPHLATHTGAKNFVCHLCGHRSRTKFRIMDHILAMHTNIRRYKCKYCDKGFSYYPDKRRHEISAHTKQYQYVCEICKRCFLKKNFLTAHLDTHEAVALKDIE